MQKLVILFIFIMSLGCNLTYAQDDLEEQFDETATELQGLSQSEIEAALNDPTAQKKDGLKDSFVSSMMTGVMKQVIDDFLKENPFSKMPRDEVKAMISIQTQNLPVKKVFDNNPKLLDMLVDWLRDTKALPRLLGIANKPQEVKIYGIIVLCVFIFSFVLNLANSKGNLFKRILRKLAIFFGATAINFATFFIMFKEELKPTLEIIFKYYHL
jgi:hypothetical protein